MELHLPFLLRVIYTHFLVRLSKKDIQQFQTYIFTWWKKNRRDLPWRHSRDPYRILVSEIMLQQTHVARVRPKYEEFLSRFPTVASLAAAPTADVLRLWKGMGYNRRALYLKKAAMEIVTRHNGQVPRDEKILSTLPGIGQYTASAIAVFAFEKQSVVVDTNIRQIITHFFFDDIPKRPADVYQVAAQLVPAGKSWEWHQALMDFGALKLATVRGTQKKKSVVGQTSVPFRESDRFFRGRLIDLLREASYPRSRLIEMVAAQYTRTPAFISALIDRLTREGLIVQTRKNLLKLPE